MKKFFILLIAVFSMSLTFAQVEDFFDKGLEYYDAGNYTKAFKYFKLAADQGYAKAQYNLGVMYEHGEGVEQDYNQAFKYYKLAADKGHAKAQFQLGWMYHDGEGVQKNYSQAVKYYKLAARQRQCKSSI